MVPIYSTLSAVLFQTMQFRMDHRLRNSCAIRFSSFRATGQGLIVSVETRSIYRAW
jgi:hypothetical protein